jgi:nucleotide-binding universal stress UspA family protein
MKTIIVINDHSDEARHAARLALSIAQKVNANLVLANVVKVDEHIVVRELVLIGENRGVMVIEEPLTGILEYLKSLNGPLNGFEPAIREIDTSDFSLDALAQLIIKNNIWMMVKGIGEKAEASPGTTTINIQSVLNRVMCPLLLVPKKFTLKDFERIVYTVDLRYCCLQVVRYLKDLAIAYGANLLIAHIAAKGLPDMEQKYAFSFFNEEISTHINYDKLFFNHIKERDFGTVSDVLINGMHVDLLVLVNHRFHFEEIIGRYITHSLPAHLIIPILIFPC